MKSLVDYIYEYRSEKTEGENFTVVANYKHNYNEELIEKLTNEILDLLELKDVKLHWTIEADTATVKLKNENLKMTPKNKEEIQRLLKLNGRFFPNKTEITMDFRNK